MLNNRLLTIAKYIQKNAKILDVGCDHAYLSIYLAQHKNPQAVIASDIVSGPVEAARKNISAAGLQDIIKLVQADGVLGIKPGEADCVIVAGMGAANIIEILTAGHEVIAQCQILLLQPMVAADKLRQWLADNAWNCVQEDLCLDNNRLYEIIIAQPSQKPYTISKLQTLIGNLQKHELFAQHLQNLICKHEQLLRSLHQATDKSQVQDKINAYTTLLEQLYEVKNENTGNKCITK